MTLSQELEIESVVSTRVAATGVSYWQIFRLIFVVFCLYLMGDAFYRWDGFRYYASFSEFVPSVALVTIFWSTVAVLATVLIWLPLRTLEWFCLRMGWEIRREHLLLFIYIFVLLVVTAWAGKRLIWHYTPTPFTLKLTVFLGVTLTAIFLTRLFHNKAERWIGIIQKRITPLVWLFGIWFVLSVPLVAYHTWGKQADSAVSQKIVKSSITDKDRPNIVLVIFDALTARDMSVYGYHRQTTPFITEWAKSASLFTKLEAESNLTTPTTASFMTGKRLWTHQTYHIGGSKPVKNNIENLPLLLKNNGYYTMTFVANPYASVKTLGIADSFEIAPIATEFSTPASLFGWGISVGIVDKFLYDLFGDKIRIHDWIIKEDFVMNRVLTAISRNVSKTTAPPEKAFNRFLEIIDDNPPEPFFAWIHVVPPHGPYIPPEPYMGMFYSSLRLRTDEEQREACGLGQGNDSLKSLRARYDEFIRYCDKQFEDFIVQLTMRNKLKNAVVILSSDHGESFEHNYLGHGGKHLYEQVTHIPLIIKEPDQTEERIIADVVEQIDIPPTILSLAGIPVPSWMEGRSLVPLMRGKKLPPRPAFSMALQKTPSLGHQITKGTIAAWEDDYKLIYYLEEKKSLLFNLKEDPDELNNLFDKETEVGKRLLAIIRDSLTKANERISRGK